MPELVEVTIMVKGIQTKGKLTKIIPGKKGRYNKRDLSKINKLLPMKIEKIFNKGKRIFIVLEDGYYLLVTLGLSGILSRDNIDPKHQTAEFVVSGGKSFFMDDMRHFGTITLYHNDLDKKIDELGYDPLHNKMSFEQFYKKYIENKKSSQILAVKLLDQKIYAGSGNYIRAEILYDTQIDPFCKFKDIPKSYHKKIYNSYKKIVNRIYKKEKVGKSYKLYAYHQDKPIIKKEKVKGRTLWYAPSRIKYRC